MGCFWAFGRPAGMPMSLTGRILLLLDAFFNTVLPSEGVPCGFLMPCIVGTVGVTDADYVVCGGAGTAYSPHLVLQEFTCIFSYYLSKNESNF